MGSSGLCGAWAADDSEPFGSGVEGGVEGGALRLKTVARGNPRQSVASGHEFQLSPPSGHMSFLGPDLG